MGPSRGVECSDAVNSVWHLKRFCDGNSEDYEEFALTLAFEDAPPSGADASGCAAPPAQRVVGRLEPAQGDDRAGTPPDSAVELDGQLTKVALRLEHRDPRGGELCVYRSERFVAEGDGQFRGVWMCGARTGRFAAARRKSSEEPRKRKSACRRKADAEIKSKRFFNDLKDELLILDRLGWTEKRWKEESKLEKGRAILGELRRELEGIQGQLGLSFHPHTPWLQRVERGIEEARRRGGTDLLRQLRAVDCGPAAPAGDLRSDWHTLFEIQRHFCALPPFRATKYLEPSSVRHAFRCAEVTNRALFEGGGLYIGGARQLSALRLPRGALCAGTRDGSASELQCKIMEELRGECIAGDLGVDEAFDVQIQLVIRAGCSEFIWEPGADVRLRCEDRVYYEQAHICSEERRVRYYRNGRSPAEMARRLSDFEALLTGGREDQVYEEDFEFVEMTARSESGTAEGVPAFLAHSVTGDASAARELHLRAGAQRGWQRRPKALNLGPLFRTRLAGYRHQRTREIEWGPGPQLHWERGDRPLRLLRMSQEPVRVRFARSEGPSGFHLQDSRGGGGVEVVEVVEGSPADARGVVVGRTVRRLCFGDRVEDARHWSRAEIEEALCRAPERFAIEFGKGDTEERRHAPLGDAEMAILMDERFMRGFLHELLEGLEESGQDGAASCFDHEAWSTVFPGLQAAGPQGPHCRRVAAAPPGLEREPVRPQQAAQKPPPRRDLSPMRVPLPPDRGGPGSPALFAAALCAPRPFCPEAAWGVAAAAGAARPAAYLAAAGAAACPAALLCQNWSPLIQGGPWTTPVKAGPVATALVTPPPPGPRTVGARCPQPGWHA